MAMIHYSAEPFNHEIKSTRKQYKYQKPLGLWFSTNKDDGWRSWCKSEDFRQDCFNYKTNIKFKPDAKVLQITNPAGVDAFWKEYGVPDKNVPNLRYKVNWPKVAQKYDAIYFPKYYPELRKKHRWYDSWDCSSGCVWNANVVTKGESKPVKKVA